MDENKKAAQKKKISHFITIAVLVILFLAFIFPFIMVIINAFKTKGDITADRWHWLDLMDLSLPTSQMQ